jgi:TolB protein
VIAFVQVRSEQCAEVRTMRADGTHVRRVVRCSFGVKSPDWSPDGARLVFVDSTDGGPGLYTVRADGSHRAQIVSSGRSGVGDAAWSPDGRMLAYVSGRSLFVVNADGTTPRRVARAAVEIDGPQWSPDSKQIVYSADDGIDLNLFVVAVVTRQLRQLTRGAGGDLDPAWSPDGKTIAFVRRPAADPLGALEVVRTNGSGRRTLLRAPLYSGPAWSPDSSRLAVVGGYDSAAEIYTITRDGSDLRRVTRNRFADAEPDWRPS